MIFRRIYDEGLSQASYLLGNACRDEALVVDPRRDIDVYLAEARREGLRIVAVAETHIHADFLSGARALAKTVGATLYLSGEGGKASRYTGLEPLDYVLLKGDNSFKVGELRVDVHHTPGHTPEHLSFLVTDQSTSTQPSLLLSGDFVFVGDVGRPDLLEEALGIQGAAETGARQMFRSLKERFLSLPDFVQVWPGHGAGSACGRVLGTASSTTVGYEGRAAWWADHLKRDKEADFVQALLAWQPEVPSYFARMKRLNRDGMPLLEGLPTPLELTPFLLRGELDRGALLVDTRDKDAFAKGHLPGSINIPAGTTFTTWAGWLLPPDRALILVAASDEVEALTRGLVRVGLDRLVGYIPGLEYRLPSELDAVPQVSADEAKALWEEGEATVLDVRTAEEYHAGHIPGARNLHAGRVLEGLEELPTDKPVLAYCRSGTRSTMAASVLRAAGLTNVINLNGGIQAWREQGYPLERGWAETATPQELAVSQPPSSVGAHEAKPASVAPAGVASTESQRRTHVGKYR